MHKTRLFAEFTTLIGTGIGVGMLGRELLKFIPVYGWAVAGAYSGAMTYALGQAFCVYLNGVKRGALPNEAEKGGGCQFVCHSDCARNDESYIAEYIDAHY